MRIPSSSVSSSFPESHSSISLSSGSRDCECPNKIHDNGSGRRNPLQLQSLPPAESQPGQGQDGVMSALHRDNSTKLLRATSLGIGRAGRTTGRRRSAARSAAPSEGPARTFGRVPVVCAAVGFAAPASRQGKPQTERERERERARARERESECVCVCECLCVWTSVTKRTQNFCNNVAHQLIDRAKVSRMFSCIPAGGRGSHFTASANEAP